MKKKGEAWYFGENSRENLLPNRVVIKDENGVELKVKLAAAGHSQYMVVTESM